MILLRFFSGGSIVVNTSKDFLRDSAQMSLDGNVGIITSETAFPENDSMSFKGDIAG